MDEYLQKHSKQEQLMSCNMQFHSVGEKQSICIVW